MQSTKKAKIIFVLGVLGLLLGAYSLYDHFQPLDPNGICNISQTINCDIVNKGPYSEVFGIPMAFLEVIYFISILVLAGFVAFLRDTRKIIRQLLFVDGIFGVIFSLTLAFFVFYKLGAFCPMCVTSDVIIIAIAYFSFKLLKTSQETVGNTAEEE